VKAAQERMRAIPPAEKKTYGQRFNAVKQALEGAWEAAKARVERPAQAGADALDVIYRIGASTRSRMLLRGDEASFDLASAASRPFVFDGDGALLRLASEAMRIRLAYLFDPYLAVHASQRQHGGTR